MCKKRWRNKRVLLSKQKTSFVSPSTTEQQRKLLVNLTFFALRYFFASIISPRREKKTVEKKIQRNVFLSINFVAHMPKIRQI